MLPLSTNVLLIILQPVCPKNSQYAVFGDNLRNIVTLMTTMLLGIRKLYFCLCYFHKYHPDFLSDLINQETLEIKNIFAQESLPTQQHM